MSEEMQTQVAEPSAETVENPAIADQNAEPAPAAAEEKPKVDAVQRRIDKLTSDKYKARAEAEMLRRELEMTRSRPETQRQEPQAKGEPKLEQFSNFEDYIAARDQFLERKFEEKLTARERQDQEAKRQSETAKASESWQKRIADARKEIPDLDDVIEAADVTVSQSMAEGIQASTVGPKIMHFLATNPDAAESMLNLSPSATLIAIGKLEAKLEAEGSKKQISGAPKPIKPVSGSGSGAPNGPTDTQSTEEWIRARNKQLGRK